MKWRLPNGLASAKLWLSLLGASVATQVASASPLLGDAQRAGRARDAILELSLPEARELLADANPQDAALGLERVRLALYEGRCGEAVALASRPDLEESDAARPVIAVARGCERATAGAVLVEDEQAGAWMRFQDGEDAVLAPMLAEVITETRRIFAEDMGVEMPRPELVRDQLALAMMTGLPVEAARTTGTIGVAKWGRVIMVSPRATPKGYPYLDTLAHELTHLALTRGSKDRAPLWLQEGVARIEETKWREALPHDDLPSADDLAALGVEKKIGPEIDRIGPSIALLPSAVEAQITYAKVMSFMRFYVREAGPEAMPKLLVALRDVSDPEDVPGVVEKLSGTPFASWQDRWKSYVLASKRPIPDDLRPDAPANPQLREVRKRVRLGELMLGRAHADAATEELGRAAALAPREPVVRALLARAHLEGKRNEQARAEVDDPTKVSTSDARWWAMRARLVEADAERSRRAALASAPYAPLAACAEAPGLARSTVLDALCDAAKRKPVAR
jgi:hypothetical protein